MNRKMSISVARYLLAGFNGETVISSYFSYLFTGALLVLVGLLVLRLTGEDFALKVLPVIVLTCIPAEYKLCKMISAPRKRS